MEVAVCAPGDTLHAAFPAVCTSPALSLSSAAHPFPAAFLPPPMTLAQLTALAATDPDALEAFTNGQPSSAAAAGTSLLLGSPVAMPRAHFTPPLTRRLARLCSFYFACCRLLAAAGRPGGGGAGVSRRCGLA